MFTRWHAQGPMPLPEAADQVHPGLGTVMRAWDPLHWTYREPRVQPLAPGRLTQAEEASVQIWKNAQLRCLVPVTMEFPDMVALFTSAPVEALIPGVELDHAFSMRTGRAYLTRALPGIVEGSRPAPRPPPTPLVRPSDAKVGPTAPCP